MTRIITSAVSSAVELLQWLLFARAILSWIPALYGSKVNEFLYAVTEPVITPFRMLLSRFTSLQTMPIDLSFLLTYLTLEILQTWLQMGL